jgi:tetratricopeptide (TPR) repeat protein
MVQMISMHVRPYLTMTNGLIFCLLFLAFPSTGFEAETEARTAGFAAADHAFISLEYEKADSLYSTMRHAYPENADVFWKLARLNVSIAEAIAPKDAVRRMPYYTKAVEFARKAVAIDSTSAAAHTWLAASLALKSDRIGTKEKLARANEIKRELDKALALNPHDDVAWSILGSYYYQISNIGWMKRFIGNAFVGKMPEGNPQAAEHAFKKAISLNPRAIRHYHELALLYIDEHRDQEALHILEAALKKPILMKSDARRLEDIRVLIKRLSETEEPPPASF